MSSIFGHLQQWKFVQQQKWAKIVFFIKVVKFQKNLATLTARYFWWQDFFSDQVHAGLHSEWRGEGWRCEFAKIITSLIICLWAIPIAGQSHLTYFYLLSARSQCHKQFSALFKKTHPTQKNFFLIILKADILVPLELIISCKALVLPAGLGDGAA